jgi:hypothetical protein
MAWAFISVVCNARRRSMSAAPGRSGRGKVLRNQEAVTEESRGPSKADRKIVVTRAAEYQAQIPAGEKK